METIMKTILCKSVAAAAGAALLTLFAASTALAGTMKLQLSGDQEVPPVQTRATGTGTITVNDDRSVSGSVVTTGMKATAAHIHQAAAGKNGPVAIPLEKKSDHEFAVPAGARLTDAQYQALKAGNLYVNVHSDAHKDGEIRAQLKP
jgi:CHRD domain